jgi:predicted signal transduction protein with EAL and GGDEF domain
MVELILVTIGVLGMALAPRGADYLERMVERADAAASRESQQGSAPIVIGQLGRLLKKK